MSVSTAQVMIMAGGTGGHIFPGLAVAKALREQSIHVVWLGSDGGMETRLVPAHSIEIETLAIKGLRGKNILSVLAAPWKIAKAIWKACQIMNRYQPQVVISFGGYAAGPGGIAAILQGRTLVVHEQNCAPGITNRVLARLASKVLTGFPNSFATVANTTVGNPVRDEISQLPVPSLRESSTGALRVLILGGSQGARSLNELLPTVFAEIGADRFAIRHQCGEKLVLETQRAYASANVPVQIEPFIQDMASAYAHADVVIGRAGALTVAEICAAGVASLLIPLQSAVDDHQAKNADFLKQHNAGIWFRQDAQLAQRVKAGLLQFIEQPELRARMAAAARSIAFPNAAHDVAKIITQELST